MNYKFTPENITSLGRDEVFVFGSNLAGNHVGGAARVARERFGAIMGKGVGMQGQSYAIPTMQGGVDTIKPYVDDFIEYAQEHLEKTFYVTRIGCGIAGFKDEEIAPLFDVAFDLPNVVLPKNILEYYKSCPSTCKRNIRYGFPLCTIRVFFRRHREDHKHESKGEG